MLDGPTLIPTNGSEIIDAFKSLTLDDCAVVISVALWLLILFIPINNIDRRDTATSFTYVLFMTAIGVLLTLAIPHRFMGYANLGIHFAITTGLAVVAGVRWSVRNRPAYRKIMAKPLPKGDKA